MRNTYLSAPPLSPEPIVHHVFQEAYDAIPGNTVFEKFQTCKSCKCCSRHQVNKPTCIYITFNTTIPENQDTHECMCPCRHFARQLNNIYNSQPMMNEPAVNEDRM